MYKYLDSFRLKTENRMGPLLGGLWSGCAISSDPRRELFDPQSSPITLDEMEVAQSKFISEDGWVYYISRCTYSKSRLLDTSNTKT